MIDVKASVHPLSHKQEWKKWAGLSPALRATDYKCPHCVKIELNNHRFYQYPRGENKGGILDTDFCPTITINAWEQNVFLIEEL